jgi:DNA invertase Pin-like site-specific DNA recombinase
MCARRGLSVERVIVDGYVRVSQVAGREGESFISPAVQREQIERWAARTGAFVAHVFEELDESGARSNRPLLERAIARVENRETDGVVVAYLSRFGRSVVDGLAAIKRITDADGSFVSVQEDVDFAGDTGRLLVRVMLSIAEWELDRVRTTWQVACERAIRRGVFIGTSQFGYIRGTDGRLRVDPETGPIATELFELRATGVSYADLRRWLMARGVRTARGNVVWTTESVSGVIKGRACLGESRYGAFVNANAHPALTDLETWERCQFLGRRRPSLRWDDPPLLWGLLRCAYCQRTLASATTNGGTSAATRLYRCGSAQRVQPCPSQVHIADSVIEPYVEAIFWQELDKLRRTRKPGPVARLEKVVEQRLRELAAYRDNPRLPVTLGAESFAAGLEVRTRRAAAARVELMRARDSSSPVPLPPAAELRERWTTLSAVERRNAIAEVIEAVFVWRGKHGHGDKNTFVIVRARAPADLVNVDQKHPAPLPPFDPGGLPSPPVLRRAADWSRDRFERELRSFMDGRERWPSFPEFQAAGQCWLGDQVRQHGGAPRWARELGVPYLAPVRASQTWTEESIHASLAGFLQGKSEWPTCAEFFAAGHRSLRKAVIATGGPTRWATLMGVDLPPRRGNHVTWTSVRMREELVRLANGRKRWPTQDEFNAARLSGLYQAIMRVNARERLAADLGLALRPPHSRHRPAWTEETIRRELDSFLEGRPYWPSERAFRDAGIASITSYVRRHGGRKQWADLYGLELAPPPFRWTDTEIEQALDEFLQGRDTWPDSKQFAHAGLCGLYARIAREGRRDHWKKRYGFSVIETND